MFDDPFFRAWVAQSTGDDVDYSPQAETSPRLCPSSRLRVQWFFTYTCIAAESLQVTGGQDGIPRTMSALVLCTLGLVACGGGRRGRDQPPGSGRGRSDGTPPSPHRHSWPGPMQVRGRSWMEQRDRDSTRTRASVLIENAVPWRRVPVARPPRAVRGRSRNFRSAGRLRAAQGWRERPGRVYRRDPGSPADGRTVFHQRPCLG